MAEPIAYVSGNGDERKALIVVFLRGAADGLNMVIPVGDDGYYNVRPRIGIAKKDAIALDGFFALHPELAALKLLVLSTHGLRDGGLTRFVATMNGATVLPVVRFRPATPGAVDPPVESRNDVERQMAEWRRAAPGVVLLDPVYMPESRTASVDEQNLMRGRLQTALRPRLAEVETLRHVVESQLRERVATARREAGTQSLSKA